MGYKRGKIVEKTLKKREILYKDTLKNTIFPGREMLAKIYDGASALFAEFEMFFVFLVFKFITFY